MIERWRHWLEETHGATFELVRHFTAGFFDSEMLSIPGEWAKVAVGVFAVLVSAIYVALPFYYHFFNAIDDHFGKARAYLEIRDSEYVFIAVAAGITALLTAMLMDRTGICGRLRCKAAWLRSIFRPSAARY